MAAATLAVKVVAAEVNVTNGARQLVLVVTSTAAATAVPLSGGASQAPDASRPAAALGMVNKTLTLNYDDVTGAITSLT